MSERRFRRTLPWLVFGATFLLTTGIGAAIIGWSHGDRWGLSEGRQERVGMNLAALSDGIFTSRDYWLLLAACAGVPAAGAIVAAIMPAGRNAPRSASAVRARTMMTGRIVFLTGVLWLVGRVFTNIPAPLTSLREAWTGSIREHYALRATVMSLLSGPEFGLAYSGLLALLGLPLFVALRSRRGIGSWVEVAVWYGLYWVLALCLLQKLLISLSLLLLGLALCSAGGFLRRWKSNLAVVALFICVIDVAMSSQMDDWSLPYTIDHVISRAADSYPYAIQLGPQHPFSLRQFWIGSFFGAPSSLGETNQFNIDLFSTMYPNTTGAVALAAPVWSYCDVGWGGVVLTLLFLGGLCWLAGRIGLRADRSLWAWMTFLFLLMQIYHLTQVPCIGIFLWGYGMSYGLTAIILVAVASVTGNPARVAGAGKGGPRQPVRS